MELLKVRNLCFSYHDNQRVLDDVSFDCYDSGLVVVLGQSGCGKSTILSLIAGYLKPLEGSIRFRKNVTTSFVFQNCFLLNEFSILENVALPLLLKGHNYDESIISARDALTKIEFDKTMLNKSVVELSGGEKGRINIARALVENTDIILLDEPTGSLDSSSSIELMKILKLLSKEHLVIMVTHNRQLAFDYGDFVYEFIDGKFIKKKMRADKDDLICDKKNMPKHLKKTSIKRAFNITLKWFRFKPKRNIVAIIFISLVLGILALSIQVSVFGKNMFISSSETIYNYNFARISKISQVIDNGGFTLEKLKYPSIDDLNNNVGEINFEEYASFDGILGSSIKVFNERNSEYRICMFEPDIGSRFVDRGRKATKYNEVVVNNEFIKRFKVKEFKSFSFSNRFEAQIKTYYKEEKIFDSLDLDISFSIVGVVNETSLFAKPAIYYSYSEMFSYLKNIYLNNLSIKANEAISVVDRIEKYSIEEDEFRGQYGYYYVADPISLNKMLRDEFRMKSIALDNIDNSIMIVTSISSVFILFLSLLLICSFSLYVITIKTLYEEQRKKLTLFKAFKIGKGSYKRVYFSLSYIFAVLVFIISLFFQQIFSLSGTAILKNMNLPMFLKMPIFSPINVVMACFSFFASYFGARLSYKSLWNTSIPVLLGEER